MGDQLIDKDHAVALKGAGFDNMCDKSISFVKKGINTMEGRLEKGYYQVIKMANKNSSNRSNDTWEEASLPTQATALKWLKDKHMIHIVPQYNVEKCDYYIDVYIGNADLKPILYTTLEYVCPYEDAIDMGLKYILLNFSKIIYHQEKLDNSIYVEMHRISDKRFKELYDIGFDDGWFQMAQLECSVAEDETYLGYDKARKKILNK